MTRDEFLAYTSDLGPATIEQIRVYLVSRGYFDATCQTRDQQRRHVARKLRMKFANGLPAFGILPPAGWGCPRAKF
jgi:hypothetical protein